MPKALPVKSNEVTTVNETSYEGSLAGLSRKIALKPSLAPQKILEGFVLGPGHPWADLADRPEVNYYPWLHGLVQEESPSRILKIGSGLDLDEAPLLQACPDFDLFIRLEDGQERGHDFGWTGRGEATQDLIHHWCEQKGISPEKVRFYRAFTGPVPAQSLNQGPPWYLIPELLRLLRDHEFDLIFIDGQVSAEYTESALDIFWPFLAPGGLAICGLSPVQARTGTNMADQTGQWPGLQGFFGREARSIHDYHLEEITWRSNGGPGSAKAFGLIRKRFSFHLQGTSPKRMVFDQPGSLYINRARIDHLLSLGLDLANKSVLEVGAGVGYLTEPFEKLGCRVVSTDARPENCLENLRRHPRRTVEVLDLNVPGSHDNLGRFDLVFCYGTLYHLSNPARCLKDLSGQCRDLLLLETCTAPLDNGRINPIRENDKSPDQSYDGTGCRPGRDWIMAELAKYFPFVYLTATQPDHPDYPTEWPARLDPPRIYFTRSVFVASRRPLDLDTLSPVLLKTQGRLEPIMKSPGQGAGFPGPDSLADLCAGLEKDPGPSTLEIMTEFGLTQGHPWAPFAVSPVNTYFASLNALARQIKPQRILEVGTAFGMSAASLIKASPGLSLFLTLDLGLYGRQLGLGQSNIDFARQKIHTWCEKNGIPKDRVKFFAVNTQPGGGSDNDDTAISVPHFSEHPELVPLLGPESFDLIFVDGKHTGDGLYNDLTSFWPLLKPGGLMLCDDLHDGRLFRGIHAWAGATVDGLDRFCREKAKEIKDLHLWPHPHFHPAGPSGQRPFGLILKRKPTEPLQPDIVDRLESLINSLAPRLTIFTMPKPFHGHVGLIQRNAISSWLRLDPRPEILLLGDEDQTAETAREFGIRHISGVKTSSQGTPLVSSVFEKAEENASYDLMAYVNTDIILTRDFIPGLCQAAGRFDRFLVVGRRWDAPIDRAIDFQSPAWEEDLRRLKAEQASQYTETGLDYFVFKKGLWPDIPPFALGRTVWDNWLAYDPMVRGVPVLDASQVITAIHQNHDYDHVSGGRETVWQGSEAKANERLAVPWVTIIGSTGSAPWILGPGGPVRRHPAQLAQRQTMVLWLQAQLNHKEGRLEKALLNLTETEKICRRFKFGLAGLYYLRGRILKDLGHADQARAAFEKELALNPEHQPSQREILGQGYGK